MSTANPLDPAHFDPAGASPEMRSAVERIEGMGISGIDRPLTAEQAREVRKLGPGGGVFDFGPPGDGRAEVRSIPGPAGNIELRCFQPKTGAARATMLHIHGGGWFIGSGT